MVSGVYTLSISVSTCAFVHSSLVCSILQSLDIALVGSNCGRAGAATPRMLFHTRGMCFAAATPKMLFHTRACVFLPLTSSSSYLASCCLAKGEGPQQSACVLAVGDSQVLSAWRLSRGTHSPLSALTGCHCVMHHMVLLG